MIKFVRKNVEKTLETELETMTHEQFLQNIFTYLTVDPPPLETDNTEEEINELEKLYYELKVKQETELQELKAKLIEAEQKVTKSSDNESCECRINHKQKLLKSLQKSQQRKKLNMTEYLIRRF